MDGWLVRDQVMNEWVDDEERSIGKRCLRPRELLEEKENSQTHLAYKSLTPGICTLGDSINEQNYAQYKYNLYLTHFVSSALFLL